MATEIGPFGDKIIFNAGFESVMDYTDPGGTVKRMAPHWKLKISPFIPPFIPVEIVSQSLGGIISSGQISKSRSQPHALANIVMVADDDAGLSNLPTIEFMQNLWQAMGKSLRDVVRPMAYCQITVDGYNYFNGLVRKITRSVKVGKSKVTKTYSIHIDELGAVYQYEVLELYQVLQLRDHMVLDSPDKLLAAAQKIIALPLPAALMALLQAFIGSSLAYGTNSFPKPYFGLSDGLPLALRLVALPPPLGAISFSTFAAQFTADASIFMHGGGGTFWDYIKQLAPEPYLEMWAESGGHTRCVGRNIVGSFDPAGLAGAAKSALTPTAVAFPVRGVNISVMLPGFNYIVCRSTPYDNPLIGMTLWSAMYLPVSLSIIDLLAAGDFVIITDEDLVDKELGQSDLQQKTMFYCDSGASATSGNSSTIKKTPSVAQGPYGMFGLLPGGIRTYGARSMHARIAVTSMKWGGIAFEPMERIKDAVAVPAMATVLNYWFRNASKFVEGTVTVRNKPWARIGFLCLYLPSLRGTKHDDPRDYGVYYIDNVTESYTRGRGSTTTLGLIRGTPIPMSVQTLLYFLMDWEFLPVGLNLFHP